MSRRDNLFQLESSILIALDEIQFIISIDEKITIQFKTNDFIEIKKENQEEKFNKVQETINSIIESRSNKKCQEKHIIEGEEKNIIKLTTKDNIPIYFPLDFISYIIILSNEVVEILTIGGKKYQVNNDEILNNLFENRKIYHDCDNDLLPTSMITFSIKSTKSKK